jgi:hypothetical protein
MGEEGGPFIGPHKKLTVVKPNDGRFDLSIKD